MIVCIEVDIRSTKKRNKDGWLVNLRIAGSISTNIVEKAVSWNVGPHGYQRGKKEIHKIFEQGPPHHLPSPREGKILLKKNSNGCFPTTGFTLPRPRVPGKTVEIDHMCIRFDSTPLGLLS